ncbi:hypothetical protein ACPCYX_27315 [Pseudomonas fluorescens]|uniref:hypothetical protein n=1 Tax=Pseudomonas fluorescens TaxID=294 RepID=UPI001240E651|nr:hypothetical protein [Pseudomonas fluorescens]
MNNARDWLIRFYVGKPFKNNELIRIQRFDGVSYMKRSFLYGTKLHIDCARLDDFRAGSAFLSNAERVEITNLF